MKTPIKLNSDLPIIPLKSKSRTLKPSLRSLLNYFARIIMSRNKLIVSAGGILYRKKDDGQEIAVVKSAKDKNWCLPKGKADSGDESLLDTAIREVEEETGCLAEAVEYAGDFSYRVLGATKMVFMWHMNLISENSRPVEPDILDVRWLNLLDAIAILDRGRERRFLSRKLTKENSNLESSVKLRLIRPASLEQESNMSISTDRSDYLPNAVEPDPCW